MSGEAILSTEAATYRDPSAPLRSNATRKEFHICEFKGPSILTHVECSPWSQLLVLSTACLSGAATAKQRLRPQGETTRNAVQYSLKRVELKRKRPTFQQTYPQRRAASSLTGPAQGDSMTKGGGDFASFNSGRSCSHTKRGTPGNRFGQGTDMRVPTPRGGLPSEDVE